MPRIYVGSIRLHRHGTIKDYDRTTQLGSLTMPVLFHCGEFDEALPSTAREQAKLVPNADVAIIPGAGHLTMIDAPELANKAIRDFLNKVEDCSLINCYLPVSRRLS